MLTGLLTGLDLLTGLLTGLVLLTGLLAGLLTVHGTLAGLLPGLRLLAGLCLVNYLGSSWVTRGTNPPRYNIPYSIVAAHSVFWHIRIIKAESGIGLRKTEVQGPTTLLVFGRWEGGRLLGIPK